ncbi:hypothetical protein FB451DRAFT_1410604 [Mycena latifolia]|nr:hypothetical protein FB451DRAFT_1410604 [Mycena latifolia]
MQSILLRAPTPTKSNDASIAKYTHLPPYLPGPYASTTPPTTLPYLPSLAWFCLTKLALYPDQVALHVRLNYRPPASDASDASYNMLRALIPSLSLPEFDWANVDPRLWATVVQIYDNLPSVFQCYPIPLADEHLRLLQSVQSTPQFSLVTILELPGCLELLDTTVFNLKHLHSLCALDASATSLSSYGLKVLSGTVSWSDGERKGPWGLRILRLRNCAKIDNAILPHLSSFQLLSILDLRGTKCRSDTFRSTFRPAAPTEQSLYHPTPLRLSVALLPCPDGLFSSQNVFTLHINTLHHPPTAERPATRSTRIDEDICVTLSAGSDQIFVGSSKEAPQPRKRLWRFAHDRKPEVEAYNSLDYVPGRSQSHHRDFIDYAVHNRIAEQELSAHARKQDVLSFYRSEQASARVRSWGYAYPPEAPMAPSAKDALLMLYRPPPPWAALEAVAPDVSLAKPASLPVVVVSDRKRAEMAEYAEQQLSEKRRKIQRTSGERPAASAPETVPLSRNPFRRKVNKPEPLPEQPSATSKPMKAISSIAPPTLPANSQPMMMQKRSQDALGQPTLPRARLSSLLDSEPGTNREKPPPAKDKQIPGTFNWGSWSKK